ncbi:unnamed protein product, partial [Amoebophrya sp. A120]
ADDWRLTYSLLAKFEFFLLLPLVWLFIPNKPELYGVSVDNGGWKEGEEDVEDFPTAANNAGRSSTVRIKSRVLEGRIFTSKKINKSSTNTAAAAQQLQGVVFGTTKKSKIVRFVSKSLRELRRREERRREQLCAVNSTSESDIFDNARKQHPNSASSKSDSLKAEYQKQIAFLRELQEREDSCSRRKRIRNKDRFGQTFVLESTTSPEKALATTSPEKQLLEINSSSISKTT